MSQSSSHSPPNVTRGGDLADSASPVRRATQRNGREGASHAASTASRAPLEAPELDATLQARIDSVCEEGRAYWHRFDSEVRRKRWHPFVAADYDRVQAALRPLCAPGRRFLEWGSASGVITIVADLMGFDACGIELDASLVRAARALAARSGSGARFAVGSFIPAGWEWRPGSADGRTGTIGDGPSGYAELGRELSDFDVVYAYPWSGEAPMMLDLFKAHCRKDARLLLHSS